LNELGRLLGIYPIQVLPIYDDLRTANWYIPVGEASAEEVNRRWSLLSSLGGLVLTPYNARLYYLNGIAPQTIGYVSTIPAEEEDKYIRNGYSRAARVGRAGIELWGEQYLAGKTGGTLYVISPDGKVISSLGSSDSQPAANIQLTIDKDLQVQAQKAIEGFRGSIVVLERDTGRVLAMVSSPEYDPNLFEPNNANSPDGITNLFNSPNQPLVNRATQGQYPLGSVFKVITFSAALESGTYTPDLKLYCDYHWTELTDKVRDDWTWDHCQKELAATGECKTKPSGELTLSQGLMRSCNPWFWHIGLDLYRQGRVSAIADMARGFGLSSPTGIGQIDEASGQISNPPGEVEAVNQAIGQGDVLVTPLQVATFMAAIGNGGTLYRPQLVEKIIAADGTETTMFKPEARSTLPLKPETLAALRDAMWEVVHNPRGTATFRFRNINDSIPIYGKTGTAESGSASGLPHAWFAGFTDAQIEGKPDIAIAVIVESQGEGSDYGAPIFKRIVETYFFGQPRSPYWWESSIGITRTPTPFGFEGTQTAQPPKNP
jgi:penicillin-binding protein 2